MKIRNTLMTFSILGLLFATTVAKAQLASGIPHLFTTAPNPPIFPAGGTNFLLMPGSMTQFDSLFAPAGFSFNFCGRTYTQVVISSNGWIALCPSSTQLSSIPGPMPVNDLAHNTTGFPIIAPLWDDLSTSLFTYIFTSNSLWIRWTCKWDRTNTAAASSLFYLKLDCTNSTISFYYANNTTYIPTSPSASIGIAGVCPGDFYSVCPTSSTSAYTDSVVENTNVGQGGANTFRPYNVQYIFTPGCWNDNCSSAKYMGQISATCSQSRSGTIHSTTSIVGNCSSGDLNDVWFTYIKPVGIANVSIMTSPDSCNSVAGTSMEVYDSCSGNMIGCDTTSILYPGFARVDLVRSAVFNETLLVRVTADLDSPGMFGICVTGNPGTGINDPVPADFEIYSMAKSIFIKHRNEGAFKYDIINLQGAIVLSGETIKTESRIVCDEFADGIYLVRIEMDGKVVNRKIGLGE